MLKFASLAVVFCFALTSCQLCKKSATWEKVINVRPETQGSPDPSRTYAERLSRELVADRVEHKIVTYQYRYNTGLREESVGQRTAIIYRDNISPNSPWWLKDEQLSRPVWLPNQEIDRQVAFYIRRHADIVEARDISESGDKEMIETEESKAVIASTASPKPALRYTRTPRIAAPKMIARAEHRALPAARPAARKISSSPERLVAKAPETRMPVAASVSAVASTDWDALFRNMHGTGFDAASELDRAKMSTLHQIRLSERTVPGTSRAF